MCLTKVHLLKRQKRDDKCPNGETTSLRDGLDEQCSSPDVLLQLNVLCEESSLTHQVRLNICSQNNKILKGLWLPTFDRLWLFMAFEKNYMPLVLKTDTLIPWKLNVVCYLSGLKSKSSHHLGNWMWLNGFFRVFFFCSNFFLLLEWWYKMALLTAEFWRCIDRNVIPGLSCSGTEAGFPVVLASGLFWLHTCNNWRRWRHIIYLSLC